MGHGGQQMWPKRPPRLEENLPAATRGKVFLHRTSAVSGLRRDLDEHLSGEGSQRTFLIRLHPIVSNYVRRLSVVPQYYR